ncbi:hypothetical protein BGZ67_005297, partial [Mortierella alpina]
MIAVNWRRVQVQKGQELELRLGNLSKLCRNSVEVQRIKDPSHDASMLPITASYGNQNNDLTSILL